MEDPIPKTIETGIYRHTKSGKRYEVVEVALHTETNEQLVVYRPLYDSQHKLFARPYDMFVEEITLDDQIVQRFTKE